MCRPVLALGDRWLDSQSIATVCGHVITYFQWYRAEHTITGAMSGGAWGFCHTSRPTAEQVVSSTTRTDGGWGGGSPCTPPRPPYAQRPDESSFLLLFTTNNTPL
jgi:hypothetical protein